LFDTLNAQDDAHELHDAGQNGHNAQKDGAGKGDTPDNARDVISRSFAGTNARNEAALPL
jgi:hypothetical protein